MKRLLAAVVLLLVGLVFATPAQAYLDPGTGSMIFQAVIGLILGILFTAKMWWGRLKSFMSGKKKDDR